MTPLPEVGALTRIPWTFSQSDFNRYAALSGDDNPIHVDPQFAAATHFGRTVAHGMLLYSVLSGQAAAWLGGAIIFREQTMMFAAPTFAGDPVSLTLRVVAVEPRSRLVTLETAWENEDGSNGLVGTAEVQLLGEGPPRFPAPPTFERKQSAMVDRRLRLGDAASRLRTFTPADLAAYRALARDQNPWLAGDDIVPPPLLGALISDLLGTRLPGRGTNWLKQRYVYLAPAPVGEALTGQVTIVRLRPEKHLATLRTTIRDRDGALLLTGEALVSTRDAA